MTRPRMTVLLAFLAVAGALTTTIPAAAAAAPSGIAPAPRYGQGLAYDAARGNVVLFGGQTQDGLRNDTWTWDGATWTQHTTAHAPSPRRYFGMAYDAAHGQVVLFGGYSLNDTWTW